MAGYLCFFGLTNKKKKSSKKIATLADGKQAKTNEHPRVKPEELLFEILPTQTPTDKLVQDAYAVVETAYEGGDEKYANFLNHDIQVNEEFSSPDQTDSTGSGSNRAAKPKPDSPVQETSKAMFSPRLLKRSCSNIERKSTAWADPSSVNKSRSYGNLAMASLLYGAPLNEKPSDSPLSVKTSCTADRVMLKKRSSSQVLPSGSRKIWWRLFLWSHRNLHRNLRRSNDWAAPNVMAPERAESVGEISNISNNNNNNNNKGGYMSDNVETGGGGGEVVDIKKKKKKKKKGGADNPTNQWVAFSGETSYFDRVSAWVNSIPNNGENDEENCEGDMEREFICPSLPEVGESSGMNYYSHGNRKRGGEEVLQANNIVQSLNVLSSVAHISGMGIKVVPAISSFTSLKAVNLSSNFIVHIPSGALPKSLHTLDLSRNKIVAIEGLRELTRLRVLNLSYNRISRIGQGLSSCTAIKELYLAGNKISAVEGLHRLLKLTVLDLSFNKITTTKALGQLVANYNSLLALNLLGNPIQTNIGDDQLKKAVSGLLPKVTYLNRQLIRPQRGREVATDRVAKAALGNNAWDNRRKVTRRLSLSQGNGSGSLVRSGGRGLPEGNRKNRHRK